MRVETARRMEVAPERVFATVADPDSHASWRPSVEEFRLDGEGPLRVGSELVETVRFLGRRYTTRFRVEELVEGRSLSLRAIAGPLPFVLRFVVEAVDGGSEVRFVLDLESRNPLLGPLMRYYLRDESKHLQKLLESGGASL